MKTGYFEFSQRTFKIAAKETRVLREMVPVPYCHDIIKVLKCENYTLSIITDFPTFAN